METHERAQKRRWVDAPKHQTQHAESSASYVAKKRNVNFRSGPGSGVVSTPKTLILRFLVLLSSFRSVIVVHHVAIPRCRCWWVRVAGSTLRSFTSPAAEAVGLGDRCGHRMYGAFSGRDNVRFFWVGVLSCRAWESEELFLLLELLLAAVDGLFVRGAEVLVAVVVGHQE